MTAQAFRILAMCAITRIDMVVDSAASAAQVEIADMASKARERINRRIGQHMRAARRRAVARKGESR